MNKANTRFLIEQYLQQKLTTAQQEELLAIPDREMLDVLNEMAASDAGEPVHMETGQLQQALRNVLSVDRPAAKIVSMRNRRTWWVAASVIALLGLAVFLWSQFENGQQKDIAATSLQNDAEPGGNKAVLTLADGSRIILDSMANGQLAEQGAAIVAKKSDGQLAYTSSSEKPDITLYNTLSTPRGGRYQVTLPDGTLVWLNASSSITYPVAFNDKRRMVSVTGEVYFEVHKDAAHPFVVNNGKVDITVLGTHFNVNAYPDEPELRVTLLEGAVKVENTAENVILQPGEQARVTGSIAVSRQVNLDAVVAWKNGSFNFNGVELPVILRQLSRWYNVNVIYKGKIPQVNIGGEMGMDLNLSQVLTVLQKTGVPVRLEGKDLIIMP